MDSNTFEVFPDVGAFPLWDEYGEVDFDAIPLSADLKRRLWAWNHTWETDFFADGPTVQRSGYEKWLAEGRELADDVARQLGPQATVSYVP